MQTFALKFIFPKNKLDMITQTLTSAENKNRITTYSESL